MAINNQDHAASIANFKKKQQNKDLREKPVIQDVNIKSNAGRPTDKNPEKKYVKISAVIEMETKKLMGQALYSYCSETHKTQNDLINSAIIEYLERHKK